MGLSSKNIFHKIVTEISVYEKNERQSIAYLIMEKLFGTRKVDIMMDLPIKDHRETELSKIISRVNEHEPIQYILEEAYFYNRIFKVNKNVLIPRPETEELVDWIIKEHQNTRGLRILDIGTGSGCIAISLAKEIPEATVFAIDISVRAIELAKENASSHEAEVLFYRKNLLSSDFGLDSSSFDLIVSNPPYVTEKEKKDMKANVLEHEPMQALFVPDADPLLFYKKIATLCINYLSYSGKCYLEINENYGLETRNLFLNNSFTESILKKDMQGRNRFIKAIK